PGNLKVRGAGRSSPGEGHAERDTQGVDTLFEQDAGEDGQGQGAPADGAQKPGDPAEGARGQGASAGARAADAAHDGSRPLPARVRPRSLQEFVGQSHLLGEGSALRTAIEQGRPHSMVLYGPPGSGKTTLARMVAERSGAAFEEVSAVQAGRAEVRAVIG